MVAHLRKGETYRDLAEGFGIGTSTVYRYLREGLELLAAMAPTLDEAIAVAQGKAFVILVWVNLPRSPPEPAPALGHGREDHGSVSSRTWLR